ncbi:hypothetical protein [Pararhizobium sp. LjRoot238]|uniref:hypothetical protein n=1 Tax=Pararhizobium sp. LjRoot238 TaxID=3342293 RepID=UPI003ECF8C77
MPIHDPRALLNRLLEEPTESAWLEFKVNNKDPREIGEYVPRVSDTCTNARLRQPGVNMGQIVGTYSH